MQTRFGLHRGPSQAAALFGQALKMPQYSFTRRRLIRATALLALNDRAATLPPFIDGGGDARVGLPAAANGKADDRPGLLQLPSHQRTRGTWPRPYLEGSSVNASGWWVLKNPNTAAAVADSPHAKLTLLTARPTN